jgi:hypothetical protein
MADHVDDGSRFTAVSIESFSWCLTLPAATSTSAREFCKAHVSLVDLPHLLGGQPSLREGIADLAFVNRLLDGVVGADGFEISDDGGGGGLDPDDTPLKQLLTRGTLGHGLDIMQLGPE